MWNKFDTILGPEISFHVLTIIIDTASLLLIPPGIRHLANDIRPGGWVPENGKNPAQPHFPDDEDTQSTFD